jgi:hypothetical protein
MRCRVIILLAVLVAISIAYLCRPITHFRRNIPRKLVVAVFQCLTFTKCLLTALVLLSVSWFNRTTATISTSCNFCMSFICFTKVKVWKNHVFWLYPSSNVFSKTQRFGNWICLHLQIKRTWPLLCWVPQKRCVFEKTLDDGQSPKTRFFQVQYTLSEPFGIVKVWVFLAIWWYYFRFHL